MSKMIEYSPLISFKNEKYVVLYKGGMKEIVQGFNGHLLNLREVPTHYKKLEMFGSFELIGYHVDYYQDGEYMGSIEIDEPDRDSFGYQSRKYENATVNIKLKKDKVIRKGTMYYTELIPLCGKVVGDIFEARKNHGKKSS